MHNKCLILDNQLGPERRLGPSGVELWVDKEALGWRAPKWEQPAPEMLHYAEGLLQRYLVQACVELERLCGEVSSGGGAGAGGAAFGSHDHKVQVHAVLSKVDR